MALLAGAYKKGALSVEEYGAAVHKALGVEDKSQERLSELLGDTKLDKQREDMMLLTEALESGRISAEQYGEAVKNALGLGDEEGGYWEKWLEGASEAMTSFDELAGAVIQNFASGFGNAFEKMVFDSQSLGESIRGLAEGMARSVVNALGQMAAQWLAYQAVQMIVGKTTQASAASSQTFGAMAAQQMAAINAFASTAAIPIVGPAMAPAAAGAALAATSPFVATVASLGAAAVGARATGGPVSEGAPYLVGERGPELFMPNTAGSIVPNNKLGGGGNVTVNLIEDKSRAGKTQERDNNGMKELDIFVADIMGDGQRSRAIQKAFGLQRRGY
jgi:phage-related minor tail protein